MQRFKEFNIGKFYYKSDKIIMLIMAIIILAITIKSLSYNNFSGGNYYYVECDSKRICDNHFYYSNLCMDKTIPSDDPLCTTKTILPGGSLGTKAPWLVNNYNLLMLIILLLGLTINTLIHNKGLFTKLWKVFNQENKEDDNVNHNK